MTHTCSGAVHPSLKIAESIRKAIPENLLGIVLVWSSAGTHGLQDLPVERKLDSLARHDSSKLRRRSGATLSAWQAAAQIVSPSLIPQRPRATLLSGVRIEGA
jgi:hypothetical protein